MPVIETKVKRWGNSLGIVIPSEVVDKKNIRENDNIKILIMRDSREAFKKTFGL